MTAVPSIRPHTIVTRKGYNYQPTANHPGSPDRRMFECLCGAGVVWCSHPDGTKYLAEAEARDTSHRRSRNHFWEYRYDPAKPHTRCRNEGWHDMPYLSRAWLRHGTNTFTRVWVDSRETPDENGNLTVFTDRLNPKVVPANMIEAA